MKEVKAITLKAERAVKQRETRVLSITSIYKPDAEAILKVLAKLLAKPLTERRVEVSDLRPSSILLASQQRREPKTHAAPMIAEDTGSANVTKRPQKTQGHREPTR